MKSVIIKLFDDVFRSKGPTKKNIVIGLADKALRLFLGFFVVSKIMQTLGPETLGQIGYGQALASLAYAASLFGLDAYAIREFTKDPENEQELLSTIFVFRFITSVLAAIGLVVVIFQTKAEMPDVVFFASVFGFAQALRFFDATKSPLMAKGLLHRLTIVETLTYLVFLGLKATSIFIFASTKAFIALTAFELSVPAIIYGFNSYRIRLWLNFSFTQLRFLLKQSFPLYLTALAVIIYTKIGTVFLEHYSGDVQTGLYFAGSRLSELLYFIPAALAPAITPAILRLDRTDAEALRLLRKLFGLCFYFSFLATVALQFLAEPIVLILYGSHFSGAAAVLKIHAIGLLPVMWGGIQWPYFLRKDLRYQSLVGTCLGAISSLVLCYFLVPKWHGVGAAWATALSFYISATISNLLFKETRTVLWVQLSSLFPSRSR